MERIEEDRIATLRVEHKGIVHQLNLVRDATDVHPKPTRIRKLILDLGALLETHFAHERANLYEPLKATLGSNSPTSSMVEGHRAMQRAFKQLLSALARFEAEPSQVQDLRSHIDSLQMMVTEYVRKEEKIIFWIAELRL